MFVHIFGEGFRILNEIWNDHTASFFFGCIVIWFSIASYLVVRRKVSTQNWTAGFVAITPKSLVMLGVFGTFFGILIGLLDFNVEDIDGSVPELLSGLKIAFTTSVVGIFAALIFQIEVTTIPRRAEESDDVPAAIYEVLRKHTELLTDLKNAISQDNDSSLLTQIQKLRTDITDGQKELRSDIRDGQEKLTKEFREFKEEMVKHNQEALIEALEKVLRDFNVILQEVIGEGFKQLSGAVDRLIEWQDKYRQYIEEMQGRLDKAVASIEATQTALEAVRAHTEAIPASVQQLQPILTTIDEQIQRLNPTLEAFAELREKAGEALPVIEENLKKVTDDLTAGCNGIVTASKEVLEKHRVSQQELNEGFQKLLDDTQNTQRSFNDSLNNTLKRIEQEAERALEEHGRLIQNAAQEAQKAMQEAWNKNSELIGQKMQELDTAFQKLLENSKNSQETFTQSLNDVLKQVEQENKQMLSEHTRLIQGSAQEAQRIMKEAWAENAKNINEQLREFDKKMQEEMTRSLEILDNQLASVSEKFVQDYTPLTERLQELVRISENVGNNRTDGRA